MIEFFNIRTGERKRADTEPMLAAFWNSSDQGPNSHEGQDFGWRVSPETLARIKAIKADRALLDHIKSSFELADEPKDIDILRWVSLEESRKQAESEQTQEGDFTRQYEDEVRALEDGTTVEPAKSNNTDSEKQPDNAKIDSSKTTKQEK